MKIIQVNCVYKKGSTGKIVNNLHAYLKDKGHHSIVCYGRGEKEIETDIYKVCSEYYAKMNNLWSRVLGIMYGGCYLSTNRLISIIKKENPDIVHLHCINGYFVNIYKLVEWLKKNNFRTVLTLHAEFMYTGGCAHALDCEKWKYGCGKCSRSKKETKSILVDATHIMWQRMYQAFENFNGNLVVVSVSPWLEERAKLSPILGKKKHKVIFNGLDTNIFKTYSTTLMKKTLGLDDEKIILHVTPYLTNNHDHLKGGRYVLELAKMFESENVKLVVAGKYDKQLCIPDNMLLLGEVKEQSELAKYYSMADVTLLTSKKETFSMVVAESLCCGTPVVGFEAGAPEQISIKQYSDFVPYGDMISLKEKIEKWLQLTVDSEMLSDNAIEVYSQEKMVRAYEEVYAGFKEENPNESLDEG